jgi:DNA-binding IclR family transcriptional regulator
MCCGISQAVNINGYYVHIMDTSPPAAGAQVLHRAAAVLRVLSLGPESGLSTTEAAGRTQLSRSTTHRILSALESEGFVDHDRSSGKWFLGPELYVLGHVASQRFSITNSARRVLKELAAATGESCFLSVRRGDETVCLLRVEGSFPLRSFVLHEGVRFPLGVGSAGLAILAFLPEPEIAYYLNRADLSGQYGPTHADDALRARLRATRENGYALNPGLIVEGSWGLGAVVFSEEGSPSFALSMTGVESRYSPERAPRLGKLLLEAAHGLSTRSSPERFSG